MSEFQYYEFRKLDGTLSSKEIDAISKLSSRAEVHGNTATFSYNYGDFKHEPKEVLTQYFDAMVYQASWGTKFLMFKIPKSLVDMKSIKCYQYEDIIDIESIKKFVVITFSFNEEGGGEYLYDLSKVFNRLIGLREDIMMGDYRSLYIAWLGIYEDVDDVDEESECEALIDRLPVPNNLKKLTPALLALVDFLELDVEQVKSVASKSTVSKPNVLELDNLKKDEMKHYIQRVLAGDLSVRMEIMTTLINRQKKKKSQKKMVVD